MASVLWGLSCSPCVLLALPPPPPLSPPSFVIPSLCFAPMALLSFLLLLTLTAPFIHCLPSCLQLQHSGCFCAAASYSHSVSTNFYFLPLKKTKSDAKRNWLGCFWCTKQRRALLWYTFKRKTTERQNLKVSVKMTNRTLDIINKLSCIYMT